MGSEKLEAGHFHRRLLIFERSSGGGRDSDPLLTRSEDVLGPDGLRGEASVEVDNRNGAGGGRVNEFNDGSGRALGRVNVEADKSFVLPPKPAPSCREATFLSLTGFDIASNLGQSPSGFELKLPVVRDEAGTAVAVPLGFSTDLATNGLCGTYSGCCAIAFRTYVG
jgi:hypothetical protein